MDKKLILDTDIGDDVDDAFALAMAAASSEPELIAVTTVYRNTRQRAQLVKAYLDAAGKTGVRVYAGERLPLSRPIKPFDRDPPGAPETLDVCQWSEDYAGYAVEEGAVEAIIEGAATFGKALNILAVGPLTNLARAVQKAPDVMRGIGGIVTMGGVFGESRPEWNILCDPEAADVVYRSGIPLRAVGLDVTLQCGLEKGLLERFRADARPRNRLLALWLERWFAFFGFEKSVMHDPLTVAALLEPVCAFETRYVRVDLEAPGCLETRKEPFEGGSAVEAAVAVDRQRFYMLVEKLLLA